MVELTLSDVEFSNLVASVQINIVVTRQILGDAKATILQWSDRERETVRRLEQNLFISELLSEKLAQGIDAKILSLDPVIGDNDNG